MLLCLKLAKVTLRVNGCTATGTRCRNPLAVNGVHNIPGGKHSGHVRARGSALRDNISLLVRLHILLEHFRIRVVSDSQEETVDFNRFLCLIRLPLAVNQACPFNPHVRAKQLQGIMLKKNLNIRRLEHPVLHGFGSTQVILADNQIHLIAQACQISSLLASRVATAHDSHILPAVKETVARRTCAHAHAPELFLRRQAQVFRRSPRRDNHRVRFNMLLPVHRHLQRMHGKINVRHNAKTDIRPETLRLLAQIFHQHRSRHSFRITGKILHFSRGRQLSAHLHPGINHRFQIRTGSINGCGITGRAGTDNQTFYSFHFS